VIRSGKMFVPSCIKILQLFQEILVGIKHTVTMIP